MSTLRKLFGIKKSKGTPPTYEETLATAPVLMDTHDTHSHSLQWMRYHVELDIQLDTPLKTMSDLLGLLKNWDVDYKGSRNKRRFYRLIMFRCALELKHVSGTYSVDGSALYSNKVQGSCYVPHRFGQMPPFRREIEVFRYPVHQHGYNGVVDLRMSICDLNGEKTGLNLLKECQVAHPNHFQKYLEEVGLEAACSATGEWILDWTFPMPVDVVPRVPSLFMGD
uniref:Matrix protein n=1 Tax=Spring viremia of carp virus TaxID=696863 RepID=A0A142J534_SVCV|nr:matrix protein [Sprivivirus cyprinus]ARQ16446.1 matrix protein [Sprivivirus cyprinus]AXA12034.1 matrix protein [Sprivivirus cyprinus]AXA12037.1 matrix protein [Sprivivirus cyprinus]